MKNNLHKAFTNAFALATVLAASVTWGQVSLPSTSPYSENFNTTPGATGTAYPTGWVSYNNATADNAMTVGTATSTTGANYNYNSRIGILGSSSNFLPSSIVLAISNTTGKSSLAISYDIIKIREQGRSNTFNLEVSTTSATSGFTAIPAGAYASGTIAEGTVNSFSAINISALDNNAGTVWIRWSYTDVPGGSGSRDGIALDNVAISWSATPTLTAPVATAASAITYNSFTANWNAVSGADSYRLDVSTSATFGGATPATDLFFSEYVEGSGSNKYLEIYNGTGAAINLSDYRVRLYANGGTTITTDVQLSGTIANGATAVLKNNSATLYGGTATSVASVNFNGNDAVTLYKISTSANVDIFGSIGDNPGTAWTSASNSTLDKTLVRKATVTGGVTTSPTVGFPTLESQWDAYNTDDITHLGNHTYGGVTSPFVPGYENLTVSGTSHAVTGLDDNTTYYYRVRAALGSTVSANSNQINLTTAINPNPELNITALESFGNICTGTQSEPQMATISGTNLTAANIAVGPVTGYLFSESATGPFTASLSLTHGAGTYSDTIYVVFAPVTNETYEDEITVSGAGAPTVTADVIGTGAFTLPTLAMTSAVADGVSEADIAAAVTSEGCTTVVERGVVYSSTVFPVFGEPGVSNAFSGDGPGAYTLNLTGLSAGTSYTVRAYAITYEDSISYSAPFVFMTDLVAAPVANQETGISASGFTANWNASAGAESYRLDVSTSATFGTATLASGLFFSEYVEGSASNKYVEIYNGTGSDVDLADYSIRLYANGTTIPTNDVALTGILTNGSVIVLRNSAATAYAGTATVNTAINFNGDDAIVLYNNVTATEVDIIGRVGEDPGSEWAAGLHSTLNKTLVRKSNVSSGVTVNPTAGFPTLESQWDVLDQDVVTNLGSHTYAGINPSFVAGYEDLTVSGTSQAVTGLTPGTTYYYRVRAVAGNTSANSNVIEAITSSSALRKAAPGTAAQSTENVIVYKQNNVLTIASAAANITAVAIYDMTGKLLYNVNDYNQKEVVIDSLSVASQILIVKAQTADNQVVVKKVAY